VKSVPLVKAVLENQFTMLYYFAENLKMLEKNCTGSHIIFR
jgi:hypothetical protein